MSIQIQLRRDTAANWTSVNPTLAQGEAGLETDTGKLKFGDGTTAWASLAYFNASSSSTSAITNDTTTNATMYPVWVTASTGNLPLKVSSSKMSFNPSTGTLLVTSVGIGTVMISGSVVDLGGGELDSVEVASISTLFAQLLNGNTITTGTGTLTLSTFTLTAIKSGDVAVTASPTFTGSVLAAAAKFTGGVTIDTGVGSGLSASLIFGDGTQGDSISEEFYELILRANLRISLRSVGDILFRTVSPVQFFNYFLTDYQAIEFGSGILRTAAGASRGKVGGTIFNDFTSVATTNTNGTEDNLYSYTLVADTLVANGDSTHQIEEVQTVASVTATRRIQKYFAGTAIFDSGTITVAAGDDLWLETDIIRESSSVVRVSVKAIATTLTTIPPVTYTRITGLTLSGTNILKTTGIAAGTGAASGDIADKFSKVFNRPAA